MRYTVLELTFDNSNDYVGDLLAAHLGELEFESFEMTTDGMNAYIQQNKLNIEAVDDMLAGFNYDKTVKYHIKELEDKNWNEEWEKNFFEPIIIDNQCVVRSTFHNEIPNMKYEIIINPQMAFGTGHHETTHLIISEILKNDFKGKEILDMGCGTSVLAILAIKKGALSATAIDIDDWCVRNSIENIALNDLEEKQFEVIQGDASLLGKKLFDVIFANINRNILLNDMEKYAQSLRVGGSLFISGFYTEDAEQLVSKAEKFQLKKTNDANKNNWMMIRFVKTEFS